MKGRQMTTRLTVPTPLNHEKLDYERLGRERLIIYIDNKVNDILSKGGTHRVLLSSLTDIMDDLKKVLDSLTLKELDLYGQKYKGFYRFIKVLEELAFILSQEKLSPKYQKQNGMKKNPKKVF